MGSSVHTSYKLLSVLIFVTICVASFVTVSRSQTSEADIFDVSLEDLMNTVISTAAKYEQKASEAPASVPIITSEDIERFGDRYKYN